MTLEAHLFQLCREQLCCEDEPSGQYSDALKALHVGEKPHLSFLNNQSWDIADAVRSNPWERVHDGEGLLSAALLVTLSGEKVNEYPSLSFAISAFAESASWPEVPLVNAQVQLLKLLSGQEVECSIADISRHFYLTKGHYWSWADAPFVFQQIQLGIVYTLIALTNFDESYLEAADSIAKWQAQLLDADGTPTPLFLREGQVSCSEFLAWNYLLNRSIAQLTQSSQAACRARAAIEKLKAVFNKGQFSPYLLLVETFLQTKSTLPSIEPLNLTETIADPVALIAAIRSKERSVFCTLTGSRTGLGFIRNGDAKILTYGPQALPLGECQQFGIEAPARAGSGTIQVADSAFKLTNSVKLPLQPSINSHPATYGMLPPPYDYAEIVQNYRKDELTIEFTPYRFDEEGELAFSFFVQARQCLMEDGTAVRPKSLDRYQGRSQSLLIQGNRGSIQLVTEEFCDEMQIIPLGGGDVFWGADYLISFMTPKRAQGYQWKILMGAACEII